MRQFSKLLIPFYIAVIFGLFFYSYTQVDLSLTLSRMSIWQVVEKSFQYIGYFQRPLSTGFYIALLVLLFKAYIFLLVRIKKGKISRNTVWKLIVFTAVVLTFSYNAFSYDLFNYIFYGKIITHYFQNPYIMRPIDFPHDPMLSFMHWTFSTYPYGPVWLIMIVPLSFLGLQIFLPTLFLYKALEAACYLSIAYCVEKILIEKDKESALFGLAIFAFSPIVIIEGLISAHNDMTMLCFVAASLMLLVYKRYFWSFVSLLISVGTKFATAMFLPVWIYMFFVKKSAKQWEFLMILSGLLMIVPIVAASVRTNFQPWYVLYLFPFVAVLPRRVEILVGYTIFSFAALLQYVPFLYTGAWNPPIPSILSVMLWSGFVLSMFASLFVLLKHRVAKH